MPLAFTPESMILNVPDAVGVPVIAPPALILRPGGNEVAMNEEAVGVAATWKATSACPTVPEMSRRPVTTGVSGAAAMAIVNSRAVLAPDGLVHLTLQNPDSIHRLVALEMGLIEDVRDISDRGRRYGTLGLWTADELEDLARDAGLGLVTREGVMLKPLPNAMMAELPAEVLDGFERAARHLPGHCAMTYLVLSHG